jgi:hypothetical protein
MLLLQRNLAVLRCWALAAAACAALTGCGEAGEATAHLQGTVTLGGKPLPSDATAHIQFVPVEKDQAPAMAAPVVNGNYDAPAVPLGAVRVYFNVTQPAGQEYVNERGDKVRDAKNLTPAKYGSGIDLTVSDDNPEQNFDLEL